MKILTVCQYYYPEPFRIHEVCEELVKRGHEVTVLTGLPNYPMGIIPDEYKNGGKRDEILNGVHVIRVSEIPRTPGKVGLAKNYVSFVVSGCLKALTMKKDFDVIFVYQLSPILMAIPAYVAKWFSHTRNIAVYCLDLWPESLVSLGISKSGAFFKFMKWVSRRIYKGAYCIAYTSRMFKRYFTDELSVKSRFVHIPQFADEVFTNMSSEMTEDSPSKDGCVNYVFAGNIGEMQSVDTIIKAADILKNEPIKWHIVGDGLSLASCRELCDGLNLSEKVIFYGRRPVEDMPEFYRMADAMIVTLADNDTISTTLPGKIQSYMAAGRPVIASANGETEKVIEDSGCGMCAPAENAEAFAEVALRMAKADRTQFGQNSVKYYNEHYTKKSHVDKIERMLKAACKRHRER